MKRSFSRVVKAAKSLDRTFRGTIEEYSRVVEEEARALKPFRDRANQKAFEEERQSD